MAHYLIESETLVKTGFTPEELAEWIACRDQAQHPKTADEAKHLAMGRLAALRSIAQRRVFPHLAA